MYFLETLYIAQPLFYLCMRITLYEFHSHKLISRHALHRV